jgi:hypothetical protein
MDHPIAIPETEEEPISAVMDGPRLHGQHCVRDHGGKRQEFYVRFTTGNTINFRLENGKYVVKEGAM